MVRPLVAYDPGDDLVSKSSEWIWHPDSEIGNTITSPKHGASIGNIFPSVLTCACFQSSEKQVFVLQLPNLHFGLLTMESHVSVPS
jgi:hypothetical protein